MNQSLFNLLRVGTTVTSLLPILLLLAVSGCKDAPPAGAQAAGSMPRQPPAVQVMPAVQQTITDYREYTGRTAAVDTVEVRARVGGYLLQSPRSEVASDGNIPRLQSVAFQPDPASPQQGQAEAELPRTPASDFVVIVSEGDYVTQGTPLFLIDPAPFELALEQTQGTLHATQAQLRRLELDLDRAADLLRSRSISQAEYDLAVANHAEAAAQIENLKAQVDRARLDLSYTRVVAPIDGLIGRTLVTVGNLVTADSTLLTTIVSQDPIYVYFDVDEQSLLDYRRRILAGDVESARDAAIPIQMGLSNEEGFPHKGVIDFVDNQTDPNTLNTRLRGRFENDDRALSPGLFARVRVPFTAQYSAVLVPTRALATDQQGRYVMTIDNEQVVHRRGVQIGSEQGDMSVVAAGLEPGELVIVSGLQKVSEGLKVNPQTVEPNGEPTT